MDTVSPISCENFLPFGAQLKLHNEWYPQNVGNDLSSSHLASALTLGESSVIKLGLNYPLRTGLKKNNSNSNKSDTIYYYEKRDSDLIIPGFCEEWYINDGVCIVSSGPLGGPAKLQGLYRPLLSYGTGISIKSVAKACFPSFVNKNSDEETFICLAEEGGISMYSKNSSETHVSHVPEFRIDQILGCSFGLLVIPVAGQGDSEDEKGLYILTHPIKQVSKIWLKSSLQDYTEYENAGEKVAAVEKDIILFWDCIHNRIVIRRLNKLSANDMQRHKAGLNLTASRGDISSRFLHSHTPNSSAFSPHTRYQKKQALKVTRDGGSITYWPSFDFSEAASRALGLGFYPPHVCVFDDPELGMNTLFQIDVAKTQWKQPQKVQLMCYQKSASSQPNRIALWYLLKNILYVHSVDMESGLKLSHYATRNILDFTCTKQSENLGVIVMLTTSQKIQIAWLDLQFKFIGTVFLQLEESIEALVGSIDNFLYNNTIICTTKSDLTTTTTTNLEETDSKVSSDCKKIKIEFMDWKPHVLVRKCIETISEETGNDLLISRIISKFIINGDVKLFDKQWSIFVRSVQETIAEIHPNEQLLIESKIFDAMNLVKQNLQLHKTCDQHIALLTNACNQFQDDLRKKFPMEQLRPRANLFTLFENLLAAQVKGIKFSTADTNLPEVLQILSNNPDSRENLSKLAEIRSYEEDFHPVIDLLLTDVFYRNRDTAHFGWQEDLLISCGRTDYLSGFASNRDDFVSEIPLPTYTPDEFSDEQSWTTYVLGMRVFEADRRLEEVCRLVDSSNVILVEVEHKAEKSDQDFADEQEKFLLQRVQIAFSAPVGRGAFTLRTEEKNYSDLTSSIFCPRLCTSGKCAVKGTAIELAETEVQETFKAWPLFHNSVAAAVSVNFNGPPADAWFAYNKSKNSEGSEQAGLIFGFGLNGILKHMPATLRHDHLAKENSFTTMAMLIGLASNLIGTGDLSTWKLISLHIGAMLPACTTELEIPKLATLIAPCALGLLFLETHNSHIAKVLLGEISKKFSPLSVVASGNYNNSATNANVPEGVGAAGDREAHSLCAGFGLGFVSLGKGRINAGSLTEDSFDGILRRFVVGGPKPANVMPGEEDMYNQYDQSLPSLWEEYRCCHIEEGENVNVDVTSPSAIIAVALIYLRSGNEAVLTWLSPPSTLRLLDGVRPDLLTLRSLASVLVFAEISEISIEWLEDQLMPKTLQKYSQIQPEKHSGLDHESINQAWASIVCGYCLGLGIRYAGTSDERVKKVVWHYTKLIQKISSPQSKCNLAEYFPKNFLDSCICTLLISLALVQAGTGDIPVLRLARYLQRKIGCVTQTTTSNFYGLEMCVSMAIGILFLGGGRYSLSNDDRSIAVILASVFPKWPTNASDNRYHLQALRHLYILAAQPRLILPKPIPHGSKITFHIEFLDGERMDAVAPVLLPPFHLLKRIWSDDSHFFKVEFNLPQDLKYLQNVVENSSILTVIPKPISAFPNYLIKQLSWMDNYEYHWSFMGSFQDPPKERNEAKAIRNIGILSGWNNVIMPSLLVLRNEYTPELEKEWLSNVQVLNTWVNLSKVKGLKTCLPTEPLKMLSRKTESTTIRKLVKDEVLEILNQNQAEPLKESSQYFKLGAQKGRKLHWAQQPQQFSSSEISRSIIQANLVE